MALDDYGLHRSNPDVPLRSEAEATLERCHTLRARVLAFQADVKRQLEAMGAVADCWTIEDQISDALHDLETKAVEAIETREAMAEWDHERAESASLMARSGVEFGRV